MSLFFAFAVIVVSLLSMLFWLGVGYLIYLVVKEVLRRWRK